MRNILGFVPGKRLNC